MRGATMSSCGLGWSAAPLAALLIMLKILVFPGVYLVSATVVEAQQFRFSTIRVEGNERVDPANVAAFAGIARGQAVTMGELNAAYQRVINSGLFEDVEMLPSGSTLIIRVREFPTINRINIEGNRRVSNDALREVIQSQERRVYSPAAAEADAAAMAELYRERGRLAAEVVPRIIRRSDNRVDLVFEVREGEVVYNERISFVGNRSYSDYRLRQVMSTRQAGLLRRIISGDTLIEDRIALDRQLLTDFYRSRGFIDFEVLSVTSELSRERNATFITFTVREGQSFRVGNVSLVSEIDGVDPQVFERELRIRAGQTFSPQLMELNIARLEQLAARQGLRFVRADPRITRNDRNRTVDVQFAMVRGDRIFVERIDIQGNVTTLDQVIRRQFRTSEGDPFNPREIREAAERIRALGYFSDVDVQTRPGSASDQAVVDVNVEEEPTGSLGFGVSYAINDGVGLAFSFSERNLLGRGQSLDITINTISGAQEYALAFREPSVMNRDLGFGLSAVYAENTRQLQAFNTKTARVVPSLTFPIAENLEMETRISLQRDTIFGLTADNSPIIRRQAGRATTSSVGYKLTYDTRRLETNPLFGTLLQFDQEIAGLGGSRSFVKTTALGVIERRVFSEEVMLRAELEGGTLNMLSGDSRYSERFQLGSRMRGFRPTGAGPRDLAAVNRDALGGNYFAVARFEAEFPLGLPQEYGITGGAFFDVGSAWSLSDTAGAGGTVVDDSFALRAAVGVSVFLDTPIGPLRLNFSRPVRRMAYDNPQNFDLTVQARF